MDPSLNLNFPLAFVTLATNDNYALGALTWAASLRQVKTVNQIAILVTKDLSSSLRYIEKRRVLCRNLMILFVSRRDVLPQFFDVVQEVDIFNSNDTAILQALKRPELGVTLTKIHCWKLTQFTKCVFMDADTLVLQNIDELFERDELSAVPDIGWPDCFNSGVFVFRPSVQTFDNLVALLVKEGSFDGGDQGLLNSYFADWGTSDISRHLSFVYNMSLSATYSYVPAYKK